MYVVAFENGKVLPLKLTGSRPWNVQSLYYWLLCKKNEPQGLKFLVAVIVHFPPLNIMVSAFV